MANHQKVRNGFRGESEYSLDSAGERYTIETRRKQVEFRLKRNIPLSIITAGEKICSVHSNDSLTILEIEIFVLYTERKHSKHMFNSWSNMQTSALASLDKCERVMNRFLCFHFVR